MKLVKKPTPLIIPPKPTPLILRRMYDMCLLQKHGVQVIRLGQTWTFIFPSDDLFDNDTPNIDDHYKPLLNVAADFMLTYPKIAVEIDGYANKPVVEMRTKFGSVTDELTQQQADAVLKYLTTRRINARLIYAVGKGSRDEVAWSGSPSGRRFNRRVEVHFRYYRDNTAWY
ncbi:MAG: OmpA family protein [Gammaproteobacteria bacterium]|nr:OmpA family protein [Gammaproteobacteria bacterium]